MHAPSTRRRLAGITLAAALAGAAGAALAAELPAVQHAGDARFMTGGIGLEESTAMKAAMKDWPLAMRFAEKDGLHADYVADVAVAVTDSRGHTTLKTVASGPFLLASVEPGTYEVSAELDGRTLHRKVEVKKGSPVEIGFVWPAQGTRSLN